MRDGGIKRGRRKRTIRIDRDMGRWEEENGDRGGREGGRVGRR